MDFNDRATGDAAILVAITQILIALGLGQSLLDLLRPATLLQLLISALFTWVIYSGSVYLVSRYLLDGTGQYAIYLRITGFAYPTLLLIVFTSIFISNATLAPALAWAGFVVVVRRRQLFVDRCKRCLGVRLTVGRRRIVVGCVELRTLESAVLVDENVVVFIKPAIF